MGLSGIKLPTATVKVDDEQSFGVRGIAFEDIGILLASHRDTMSSLFDRLIVDGDGKVAVEDTDAGAIGVELLNAAPGLVAEIIARASGEPDQAALVRQLPFPVQLDALEKVAGLTFTAENSPKKVLEAVIRAMRTTTALISQST